MKSFYTANYIYTANMLNVLIARKEVCSSLLKVVWMLSYCCHSKSNQMTA